MEQSCSKIYINIRMYSKTSKLGILTLAIMLITGSGCIYYNTFYWARQKFNNAEHSQYSDRDRQNQNDLSQAGNRNPSAPNQPPTQGQNAGQQQVFVSQVNAEQRTLYEDAIKKATKVLKYHPNSSWADDALWLIGKSYYNMGDNVLADRKFKELVTNYPKSKFADEAYYYMGLCQINLAHNDFALTAFQSIETTDKKSQYLDDALFAKGVMEMLQDDNESASDIFSQYLEKYPNGDSAALAEYNVGLCKDKLKDYVGAFQSYSKVKKHNPGKRLYFESSLASATAALNTDSLITGMKILQGLADDQSYFSMSGKIRLRIAEGHFLQDSIDQAIEVYKDVTVQNPHTEESAEAYYQLGLIYQNNKFDMTSAKDAFSKAQNEFATSDFRNLALARSAQIAKLERYQLLLQKADSLQKAHEQELAVPKLSAPVPKDSTATEPISQKDSLKTTIADTLLKSRPFAANGDSTLSDSTIRINSQVPEVSHDASSAVVVDSTKGAAAIPVNTSQQVRIDSSKQNVLATPDSLSHGLSDTTSNASRILKLLQSDTTSNASNLPNPVQPVDSTPPPMMPAPDTTRGPSPLSTPASASNKATDDSLQIVHADSIRQALVDSGIVTRYMLSELYVYELNRPDSALSEYLMIAKEYPNSPYAAKSLLAAARIEDNLKDTVAANGYLRQIITAYPRSPEAVEAATTLKAPINITDNAVGLYAIAESLVYQGGNPDSAIVLFKYIAQQFPDLAAKASYAVAWILDSIIGVEDSSAYYAYDNVIKNYPQTIYADRASERLGLSSKQPVRRIVTPKPVDQDTTQDEAIPDSTKQLANGLPMAPPTTVQGQFLYPYELLSRNLKGVVLFKIKLDVAGKVSEQEIIGPSGEHAIDSVATVALLQTQFDVSKLDLMQLDSYFQYPLPFKRPNINQYNDLYQNQQQGGYHH